MTFREAQHRLLAYVVDRIHNGELTERGLARLIGISQPHAHNVLKGIRNFSPEICDAILKYFKLSLLDLAPMGDLEANLESRRRIKAVPEVPFLDGFIGPGNPWPTGINWMRSYPLPMPAWSSRTGLVMADLAQDPDMHQLLAAADVALLDTSAEARSESSPPGLFVIARAENAVIRYVRPGARGFYLVADAAFNNPVRWEYLSISPGDFARLIRARVRWLGRLPDPEFPEHQRGRPL